MFQFLLNLGTCSNYSVTKYVKILVFHFVEEVNKGQLKMVNVNYLKMVGSNYIVISNFIVSLQH